MDTSKNKLPGRPKGGSVELSQSLITFAFVKDAFDKTATYSRG